MPCGASNAQTGHWQPGVNPGVNDYGADAMTTFSLRWSVPIVALAAAAALISYDGALAEQRTKQGARGSVQP